MISTFALLPIVAAAGAMIDGVGTNFDGENLTVEVSATGKLSAHDLTVKPGKRRFYLYVGDAKADRAQYVTPERTVVAHPRAAYTKLEIPWGNDVECDSDVAVETIAGGGARATVKCHSTGDAAAATRAGRRASSRRSAEAPAAAPASGEKSEQELLREALALPTPGARKPEAKVVEMTGERKAPPAPDPTPVAAPAPKAAEPAHAEAPKPAQAEAPKPAHEAPAHEASPVAQQAEPAKPATPPAAHAAPSSGSSSFIMPALLLAALGVAAFVLTKRRARKSNMINILESASLGPKRALVVASVNGKTMILGTSEAGITLLGSLDDSGEVTPVAAAAGAFKDDELSVDEASPHIPSDQEGILARLFRKRAAETASDAPAAPQESWKQFDELLNESLEDQELRHKLASGIGGKVS